MFGALLATALFAMSAVFAGRLTRVVGGNIANFARLCLALVLLCVWALSFGVGFGGGAFWWFFLSGCIGFGLGDVALYQALPRLGSRLSILIVHCLAAPMAIIAEWMWLGTRLTPLQLAGGLLILLGVALALAPQEHLHLNRRVLLVGLVAGIIAAFGQAGGAVISRKAYEVVASSASSVDGGSAAFQRILGGVLVSAIAVLWVKWRGRRGGDGVAPDSKNAKWREALPWLLLNAVTGPTTGVACYQWALATAPSGVVLPLVATTPLLVVPFSYHLEQDRPGPRALLGGVVAVAGAVLLAATRAR